MREFCTDNAGPTQKQQLKNILTAERIPEDIQTKIIENAEIDSLELFADITPEIIEEIFDGGISIGKKKRKIIRKDIKKNIRP